MEVKMTLGVPEFDTSKATDNLEALAANPYPGRGIILGRSSNEGELVEAYWVMGRSENSRNRVLVEDGSDVKTIAHDPEKVEDPSLIMYNAMRRNMGRFGLLYVVSNGDQTDSVHNFYERCGTSGASLELFREALLRRDFEPNNPNFTPRITGAVALGMVGSHYQDQHNYAYSIIRRNSTTGMSEHTFGGGDLDDIPAGSGLCFHTYRGDGNPLPSFEGSPYAVPLGATADEIADELWESLDKENRVGLAVRTIDSILGSIKDTTIINQLDS